MMRQKSALIISSAIILGMFALSAWTWFHVPEQPIPVHFGPEGQPDRYGSKFEGLLLLPLVAFACNLLLTFLPRIEPRREHLLRSSKAYQAVWIVAIALLAAVHGSAIAIILGKSTNLSTTMVGTATGILLMVMGNYLGKVRSNFSFGIRTPWTLSSEKSWYKSHRLGGWLLFGLGLVCMLASIAGKPILFLWLLLVGTGGITLVLLGYSYLIWKNDPDKHRLGQE
jgi:uncharacterized membrane protein